MFHNNVYRGVYTGFDLGVLVSEKLHWSTNLFFSGIGSDKFFSQFEVAESEFELRFSLSYQIL